MARLTKLCGSTITDPDPCSKCSMQSALALVIGNRG
jgi:hypothetical protein